MAGTLGSLIVDIGADVARLRRDMGKASKTVTTAMNGIRRSASIATSALGGLGAGLAAGLSGQAVRQAIADTSLLFDNAQKLGLAAENLQAYQYAAIQVGLSTQNATLAIQRFTRRLAEAAQGTGELKGTLEQYNIAVVDANGNTRDSEAVLADLADAIQGAGTDAEKLRIAFKAFDSEGAGFVNVLRNGREGLKDFQVEAAEAGAILDESLVAAAKELDGELTKLSKTIEVRFKAAILNVAVAIRSAFDTRPVLLFGKELEDSRKEAGELQDRIESLERGGVTRSENRTLATLRAQLRELQDLDPDIVLAGYNARIIEAQQQLDGLSGRALRSQQAVVDSLKQSRDAVRKAIDDAKKAQSELDAAGTTGQVSPPVPPTASSDAKDFNKEARQLISTLRDQQIALKLSADEFKLYEATQLAAKVSNADLRAEVLQTADAYMRASASAAELQQLQQQAAELRESLKGPFELAADELDRFDTLLEKDLITIDEWSRATNRALDEAATGFDDAAKSADDATETIKDVFKDVGRNIEDSITDAVRASSLSLESLADLANSIFDQIAKSIIQTYIASPITKGITSGIESFIDGAFATGGYARAGGTYLVGERGPELFTPGASGTVTPNSALGQQVNINFTVNSLDPTTAAQVIAANRNVIVGVVRGAFNKAGQSVSMA